MCKRSWKIGDRIRVTGRESLATYSLLQNEAIERKAKEKENDTEARMINRSRLFFLFLSFRLFKKKRERVDIFGVKKRNVADKEEKA